MKIVHLCLGNFYIDNYSYQENMLPKYHKMLGYEVEIIASLMSFDKNGKQSFLEKEKTYENEYGIKVTRIKYKKPYIIFKKLKKYIGTYNVIVNSNPDILFIHGCQFLDMNIVVKYLKKHSNVKVYVDNHADFINSATNWLSKNILHKLFWKHSAKIIEPYVQKFYGVTPARVDFLKDVYKLPSDKCELLIMGIDDEIISRIHSTGIIKKIYESNNIQKNDFVIVTGGKIDKNKYEVLNLMEAVKKIGNKSIKLLVFGSVDLEIKDKFDLLCGENIIYIGWLTPFESDAYFAAADLAIFPGLHSVFWEQVVGLGIPMLCKYFEGASHIDIGGNVDYLYESSINEIKEKIEKLLDNEHNKYLIMKRNAQKEEKKQFLYSEIAKKSIDRGEKV